MPGYDGTGPRGMGPMSGRARGYCAVPGGGRGFGMGLGTGRGFGRRGSFGGMGRGRMQAAYARDFGPWGEPTAPQSQPTDLRQEVAALEAELARLRALIDQTN